MRVVGIVPGAKLFASEDMYADHYLFVNAYPKRISANGGTPVFSAATDTSFRRRWRCARHSFSAAAHAFTPIIFRSWNTLRKAASPCSASASGCR